MSDTEPLGELVGPSDEVYTSFEEAPVDEVPENYHELVGDDALVADGPINAKGKPEEPNHLAATPKAPPRRKVKAARSRKIVPHPRDLRFGKRGSDVTALQRALAAAKVRKWGGFTKFYGLGTRRAVRKFQKAHGLKVDGIYGLATHKKLARYYDAHGIKLLNEYATTTSGPAQRKARLLTAAHVAYNYGTRIHYTQGSYRMMMVTGHIHHEDIPKHSSLWGDCSGFATWMHWDSSTPPPLDPNGLGYNGYGFTGTLAEHGIQIPIQNAGIGDLFFYGYRPYRHVTICVGENRCISQGTEYGPNLLAPDIPGLGLSACRHYPGF